MSAVVRIGLSTLVGALSTIVVDDVEPMMKAGVAVGVTSLCYLFFTLTASASTDEATKSDKKKKKKKKKTAKTEEVVEQQVPSKAEPAPTKKNKKKSKKAAAAEPVVPEEKIKKKVDAGKKKKNKPPSKKAAKKVVESEEDDVAEDDADEMLMAAVTGQNFVSEEQTGSGMSKSASRRKRAKENKAAATFEEQQQQQQQPAVTDSDGFTTHVVKRRPRKAKAESEFDAEYTQEGGAQGAQEGAGASSDPSSVTLELETIKPNQYGVIIGQAGATLKMLQEATNTRIDVPKKDGTGVQTVTISGSRVDANRCKQAVISLVTKGFSSITDPGTVSGQISVPPAKLGHVIGPGGANIKKLMEKTDTKINTPERNSDSTKVTIAGSKDDVRRAKEAIKQLIELGFSDLTHEGYAVESVDFPEAQYRLLIGPGGHTIKSIQGDTKCKINIPNSTTTYQDVQVVGPKDQVARAVKQILRLLDRAAEKEKAAEEAMNDEDNEEEAWY